MSEEQILLEVTRRLVTNFKLNKIILFGSRARGRADARSDYDFLVVASLQGKRRNMIVAMDRALRGMEIGRDIVLLTPEEFERDVEIPGTIARPAWLEGRVLYADS
ncbi:MAG: nucleotidyltransferase domain-containing protein [Ignavibacteriae bacterium]|nr:nucleotidyltransferase domain-containing protein [Ignavibacteriota bacterium]